MPVTNLSTEELVAADILPRRSGGLRDPARESRALDALVGRINAVPENALQALVETVAELCGAGSAGVSLLDRDRFVWPAIAGAWGAFVRQGLPRDASPCGVVVARNIALLFDTPRRIFPNIDVEPAIQEVLLVPLVFDGRPEGTLWAISHDEHRFTTEDARILDRLALVATAIEQTQRLRADRRRQSRSAQERMRHTLAVIRQMVRNADAVETGREGDALLALSSRIDAFADGLAQGGREGVDLWRLVAHVLDRHGEQPGGRVQLDGAPVSILAEQAGPLALAFHELVENAFQHGALSRTGGKVAVDWRVEDRGQGRWLSLHWRESGGLAPVVAAAVRGFGLELLEEGLPDLIGAETRIDLTPARFGLSLTLDLTGADPRRD